MENLKFLTTINGIYNFENLADNFNEFNINSILLVYGDPDRIKIIYKELEFNNVTKELQFYTREGKYTLDDLGEMTTSFIFEKLTSKNEFEQKLAKELIFADFNDRLKRYYTFSKIY